MVLLEVVSALALLTGVTLNLIAAIGLHRLPDVFARMHAATKPATLGLVLVIFAVALHLRAADAAVKLLSVVALQFLTAPSGMHMIGRSAYGATALSAMTIRDEYGDDAPPPTADGEASR